MKVVAVTGSPRKQSNSSYLAEVFAKVSSDRGANVRMYNLRNLKFRGCSGCRSCKTSKDYCMIKDDLTEVLESVKTADILVLSTPLYFDEVSGLFKNFWDRTYSLFDENLDSRLEPGKRLLFIVTQAAVDETMNGDLFNRYLKWFKMHRFLVKNTLGTSLTGEWSVMENLDLIKKVQDTAKLWIE